MKLTFYSNYLNHHQIPLSNAFYRLLGNDYTFVATTPFNQARSALGYVDENKNYPYVLTTYDSEANAFRARELAVESDVIIIGSAPEKYIRLRIPTRKPVFRYSERPYKKKLPIIKYPKHFLYLHAVNPLCTPIYMLCASAYTPIDYARFGLFLNRTFQWGYFPEAK